MKNEKKKSKKDNEKNSGDSNDNNASQCATDWKEHMSDCIKCLNHMDRDNGHKVTEDLKDISNYTVVVSQTGARTMKVLIGLARATWIVTSEWIEQSFNEGKWLPPDAFQWSHYTKPLDESAEKTKKQTLFHGLRVHVRQGRENYNVFPTSAQLETLVELCGANVVMDDSCDYDYIISEKEIEPKIAGKNIRNKPIVSAQWLFDSLQHFERLPIDSYKI
ncbi:hypothetical protein RFI_13341 [Reticulomyxa filosa]|uniref:BRCT domain-containing protein n=1 Tax=Reticulomyxa filosa TaxID=46433 RepID=X6NER1_RETFI|nr:hypothetical protein RFI_13341 [Reticulomyxa filosa]|eukprot:ETO23827.1 hypothetical protein RFI_13341 [Reticulomyxa filosa]